MLAVRLSQKSYFGFLGLFYRVPPKLNSSNVAHKENNKKQGKNVNHMKNISTRGEILKSTGKI